MNAKKAKALRKLVRNLQKQQGELPAHGFVNVKNTAKHVMVNVPEATPETLAPQDESNETSDPKEETKEVAQRVEKITIFDGQKRVAPRSQRAIYLHLKSELEKVEIARRK